MVVSSSEQQRAVASREGAGQERGGSEGEPRGSGEGLAGSKGGGRAKPTRLGGERRVGDKGGQKQPPLTLFSTPLAPRRARDRLPSILALGNFSPSSLRKVDKTFYFL